jgi:hypothetical protein
MTLLARDRRDLLALELGAARHVGEVGLLPVLDLGADDAGGLQHVVGDTARTAQLRRVAVAVLDHFHAAIEIGHEGLDRLGGVFRAGRHVLAHARDHLALDAGLQRPALLEHRAALADAAV